MMFGVLGLFLVMIGLVIWFPAKNKANSIPKIGVDEQVKRTLPTGLGFTDEHGDKVLLADYFNKGKPVLMVPLFYECKGTCLMITEAVIQATVDIKASVGDGYDVIVFSLNPNEKPSQAMERKNYMLQYYTKKVQRPGAEKGWHCLVGEDQAIKALCNSLGYRYIRDKKTGQIQHPASVMVVSPGGLISQYFYGDEYPSNLVAKALDAAREEKVNTVASEKKLLGCLQFNPSTGKYVNVASNTLAIASQVMVAITFLSVMYLTARYRHNPPFTVQNQEQENGNN